MDRRAVIYEQFDSLAEQLRETDEFLRSLGKQEEVPVEKQADLVLRDRPETSSAVYSADHMLVLTTDLEKSRP